MIRHRPWSTLLVSYGLALALPAFAAPELTLYRGEPVATQGLTVGGWGSGYAIESQREFFTGSNSLDIRTDGYFAGGRIDFTPPIDLTDAFANRNTYLVLTVRFPSIDSGSDSIGAGTFAPARGQKTPGLASPGTTDQAGPNMSFFRVLAVVNGTTLATENQPIDLSRTESGWTTLSFPLAALQGAKPVGRAMLSRLMISGDRPDEFFVGEIRTTLDDADIVIDEAPEDQTANPGDPVQLTVTANGGLANLQYIWDFNKSDGLQRDAFGQTVVHSWRDPGDYTATLTIRDINGIKPDLVQEIPVTIVQ